VKFLLRAAFVRWVRSEQNTCGLLTRNVDFLSPSKKKVGNAPVRNRIKRLLREGLRHHRRDFEIPHDICLMVTRPPKLPLEFGYVNGLINQLAEDLNHHPQTISSVSQND
jgi:RNase P protein component